MNTLITSLYNHLRGFVEREEGQDLVEYALVVACIAFGSIMGMGFLATGIDNEF
jgi:Flp pilus assembly pilin Flp